MEPEIDRKLESILKDFKAYGMPVSKIESDLGFSNGLLGKALKGKTKLSTEKMEKLNTFYAQHWRELCLNKIGGHTFEELEGQITEPLTPQIQEYKISTLEWIKKVEDYCMGLGITPEELIEQHKAISKKETDSYNEGLRNGFERAKAQAKEGQVAVKDMNAQAEPKSKSYDPYKDPTWRKKMGLPNL